MRRREGREGGGGERSFLYCAAESRHRFSFLSDKVRLKVFIFSKKKKKERERETGLFSVLCAHLEAGIAVSNPHHPIQGRNKKCVTGIAFFFYVMSPLIDRIDEFSSPID